MDGVESGELGKAIGLQVAAPSFAEGIFNYLKDKSLADDHFNKQKELLQQKEKNSEIKKYLDAIQPNYEGIHPRMMSQYHDEYLKTMTNLVNSFKGASTDVDVVSGAKPILDDYEMARNKYVNTSKSYFALGTEKPENLDPTQRIVQRWVNDPKVSNDDFKDNMGAYMQKGNVLGSVSWNPDTMQLGMNASPKPDYTKDDETVGAKLKDWQVTNVKQQGLTTEQIFSVPYTNKDAQAIAQKYNMQNVPSVESAYEDLVNKYGGEKAAVTAWLHTDEGFNNPDNWKHGDPSQGADMMSAAKNFKDARMKGIANNAPTKLEKVTQPIPQESRVYSGEKTQLSNVISKDPLDVGGNEYTTTNFHSWSNVKIPTVPASNYAIDPSTGKVVSTPELTNAVILSTRNIRVDGKGNMVPDGSNTPYISVPMMFVVKEDAMNKMKDEYSSESTGKSSGGQGGMPSFAQTVSDSVGTKESRHKTQGSKESSSLHDKVISTGYWVPVRGYTGTEFGVTNESFNSFYGSYNDSQNQGKSADLQKLYSERYSISGSYGGGNAPSKSAPSYSRDALKSKGWTDEQIQKAVSLGKINVQ